ncbi:ATP-binding protein [Gordonia sp. HNM0687]|uniref:ATP-binding protein n=1 Tax=Gordonia mangrovi TaxID=2665643 RepID=A0A6L7GKN5_9ACTN|nr:ATP-binding protein [Gordonia mangrovi]MXP20102.1 ATP-binding protein [Gordonia mangrovi]UVF79288.1 ATP-binding protein [Gordonia mangrovi]
MAADTAALPEVTDARDERDEYAGRRILRLLSGFVAVGYLAYALMTASMVVETAADMQPWWTVLALILTFGTGLAMAPAGWWGDVRRIRLVAGVAACGYAVSVGLWWFAWSGQELDLVGGLWLSQFPGLAAIAAALAFRPVIAFGYLFVVNSTVIALSHLLRPATLNGPLFVDIAWGCSYSLIFVSAAVMAIRTAGILDQTRSEAFRATAAAAAADARSTERSRFDALTHDNVMSTLLTASRRGGSPELAEDARAALAAVDRAAAGDGPETVGGHDAISQIRAAVGLVDPTLTVRVHVDDPLPAYPGEVVSAIASASAEAVRNSRRHAGAEATTTVTASASPSSLRVDIRDDGRGFDPTHVPASRLGIAVSVLGRIRRIEGGAATVESRPGGGTRVVVEWSA